MVEGIVFQDLEINNSVLVKTVELLSGGQIGSVSINGMLDLSRETSTDEHTPSK